MNRAVCFRLSTVKLIQHIFCTVLFFCTQWYIFQCLPCELVYVNTDHFKIIQTIIIQRIIFGVATIFCIKSFYVNNDAPTLLQAFQMSNTTNVSTITSNTVNLCVILRACADLRSEADHPRRADSRRGR